MPEYLSFNKDTGILTLAPLLEDPVGNHMITMKVSLLNYPAVVATSNFELKIIGTDDCAFDTLTFGKNLDDAVYKF